jgi:uncharacterized membrane protein
MTPSKHPTLPGHDDNPNRTRAVRDRIEHLFHVLRLPRYTHDHPPVRNANDVHDENLSRLDRFALAITTQVGSIGFFLIILAWTALWCGYNLAAVAVPALHWHAFDPFPAFVVYLLISNVIQILLMPLIMVGQNLQGRHAETRAQLDFEINMKAEQEIMVVLHHLEHNTELLLHLMKHLECRVSEEEVRALTAEHQLADRLEALTHQDDPAPAAVSGRGPQT